MKAAAFSTLAAVACLLVLIAAVAGVLNTMQQTGIGLERAARDLGDDAEAQNDLAALLKTLEKDGEGARWVDEAASFVAPSGRKAVMTDLSGRLNLNGVTSFFLGESRLSSTLVQPVDRWWAYRDQHGPRPAVADYGPYFEKNALVLFTTLSRFNLNTVDETMLEKMAALRTGDSALGASLRAQLRRLREDRKRLAPSQVDGFLGLGAVSLRALFTAVPELNVNAVSTPLLAAVVSYPPWGLPQAETKTARLVEARRQNPVTPEELRSILDVPEDHAILGYLGTESWFAEGRFSSKQGTYRFVLERLAGEEVRFRIVEQGWER